MCSVAQCVTWSSAAGLACVRGTHRERQLIFVCLDWAYLAVFFFCDTGFGPCENACTLRIQSINSIEVRALYAS